MKVNIKHIIWLREPRSNAASKSTSPVTAAPNWLNADLACKVEDGSVTPYTTELKNPNAKIKMTKINMNSPIFITIPLMINTGIASVLLMLMRSRSLKQDMNSVNPTA